MGRGGNPNYRSEGGGLMPWEGAVTFFNVNLGIQTNYRRGGLRGTSGGQ